MRFSNHAKLSKKVDFVAIFPQISWFLLLNSISADSISAALSFPQGTALIGDFLYLIFVLS